MHRSILVNLRFIGMKLFMKLLHKRWYTNCWFYETNKYRDFTKKFTDWPAVTAREKVWTCFWYHYLFTAVSLTLWRLTLSYSHKQIPQLKIYTELVIIACWDLYKAQYCNNDKGSQVRRRLNSSETEDKQKFVLKLL